MRGQSSDKVPLHGEEKQISAGYRTRHADHEYDDVLHDGIEMKVFTNSADEAKNRIVNQIEAVGEMPHKDQRRPVKQAMNPSNRAALGFLGEPTIGITDLYFFVGRLEGLPQGSTTTVGCGRRIIDGRYLEIRRCVRSKSRLLDYGHSIAIVFASQCPS